MSKNWKNLDNLFNPNLVYDGDVELVLKDYPTKK